jgi:phosphotransferase system HPr-like phosphotransfer protein
MVEKEATVGPAEGEDAEETVEALTELISAEE